jgi:hypothetical protein
MIEEPNDLFYHNCQIQQAPFVIGRTELVAVHIPDPQRKDQALPTENDKKRIAAKRIIVMFIFIFHFP